MSAPIIEKYTSQVKDVDYSRGLVTLYSNSFNVLDSDKQISQPGSFKKTIKDNFHRLKWFLNHDRTKLLGVPVEAREDQFGVLTTGQLNMKKEMSRDILEDYKLYAEYQKTLEHSVMVQAMKSEVLEGDNVPVEYRKQDITWIEKVYEWKWWEFSTLTSWGSNDQTPLVSIKNLKDVHGTIDWLNAMLKGNYTDERLKKVEETISILQSLKDEPLQTTQKSEPGDNTQDGEPIDELLKLMSNSKLFNNGR